MKPCFNFLTACYRLAKPRLTWPGNFAGVIARCIFASSNETITNKQTKTNKMKKVIIIAAAIIGLAFAANAQNATSSASQTTKLSLANAVEITFTGSGTATGGMVTLPFTTVDDYANGVASTAQTLKVRSNKAFGVTVKTNAANFTYSGSTTPAPTMPVANILKLKVSANNTGGSIASGFSSTAFSSLSNADQNLISNGTYGGNQNFDVMYEATPGFAYPAGDYTVNVVYTVTQQ
jgi:uncharacterized protein YraI